MFTAQHGYEADGYYGAAVLAARPHPGHQGRRRRGDRMGAAAGGAPGDRGRARGGAAPGLAGPADLRLDRSAPRASYRDDADGILLAAVLGGADQHDLARLAREMLDRAQTSPDRTDGFDERALWLGTTFGGAGRLQGDLTPACAAALTVVLDALGQKAGPEDTRTAAQRRHDAIEEACRRLISGQLIPGRDGQPPHLTVHIDLDDLRGRPQAPPGTFLDPRPGRGRARLGVPDRRPPPRRPPVMRC